MTQYPPKLTDRFAATLQSLQQRVTKLESRTSGIDSGFPLMLLPGVIDSGYTSGNPMAYVNGAATLSGPYACLASYSPVAGDSVILAPVGAMSTYIVVGRTSAAPWQQITPGGSWSNSGSGVNGFFYRLMTTGDVQLSFDVTISSATPGTLGTLPAGYRPSTSVNVACGWYGSGPATPSPGYNPQFSPHLLIATDGTITGQSLYVGTISLFGTATLPMGAL